MRSWCACTLLPVCTDQSHAQPHAAPPRANKLRGCDAMDGAKWCITWYSRVCWASRSSLATSLPRASDRPFSYLLVALTAVLARGVRTLPALITVPGPTRAYGCVRPSISTCSHATGQIIDTTCTSGRARLMLGLLSVGHQSAACQGHRARTQQSMQLGQVTWLHKLMLDRADHMQQG